MYLYLEVLTKIEIRANARYLEMYIRVHLVTKFNILMLIDNIIFSNYFYLLNFITVQICLN